MIQETIFYIMTCDRCKKYRSFNSEYDYHDNKHEVLEYALDDGWIEKDGHYFCPDCQKPLYTGLQNDPMYEPKPWIPKEIWKAKDVMRHLGTTTEYIKFSEDDDNFYLRKYAGFEGGERLFTDGELEVLKNTLSRPAEITYEYEKSWPRQNYYCIVKIPKTEKEK